MKRCSDCRRTYANWDKKSLDERRAATAPRGHIRGDGPLRVKFNLESNNRKTGPIPVSMTSARTCPTSCGFYNSGCYAEQHLVGMHWRRLSAGEGLTWREFCSLVTALPPGQIWRHNEAGDLPGDDEVIDAELFAQLVQANFAAGARAFTYTHKPLTERNVELIRAATAMGFVVNVSADCAEDADQAADMGLPTTVVVEHNAPTRGLKTPAGRTIVVCPAEDHERVTCESCGLCAVSTRKSIVGFRAHGDRKYQITTKLRQLPLLQ